jgi:hypothetical protein
MITWGSIALFFIIAGVLVNMSDPTPKTSHGPSGSDPEGPTQAQFDAWEAEAALRTPNLSEQQAIVWDLYDEYRRQAMLNRLALAAQSKAGQTDLHG